MGKVLTPILSLIFFIFPLLLFPFPLSLHQKFLLGIVLMVILWWTTGTISRTLSSIFLLGIFILFSHISLRNIFRFPLSSNFYLIVFTFLLSEGMVKSNLVKPISQVLLGKFGHSPLRLIILSFVLGFFLMFFIPQPFPRVILLSTIYIDFLKEHGLSQEILSTILFSIYAASTSTSMIFINGDMLLNYSALQFGNLTLNWMEWAIYMSFPAILISFFMLILYVIIFNNNILNIKLTIDKKNHLPCLNSRQKQVLVIYIMVFLLFMTESLHGIAPVWISLLGVILLFFMEVLDFKDIKKVNIHLLVFLTAAFSIGSVLNGSGIAGAVSSKLFTYLPNSNHLLYYVIIIMMIMILHLLLGSAITTISVVLPGLINMPGVHPIMITFIVYTVVSIHYLLPFHHATIMIGAGEEHYPTSYVVKYGLALTVFTFIAVLFIEIPWWKFMNLL